MLDVVLQLLMFFLTCINLATGQVAEEVTLPKSTSVKPVDKTDPDWLYVNFKPFHVKDFETRLSANRLAEVRDAFRDGDACIQVLGADRPMKLNEFRFWLKQQFENAERVSRDGKVTTTIIIRADKNSDYSQVFELLYACKVVGYTRMKLQALTDIVPGANS
jgi:biopolymer transport protein ExbD